MAKWQVRLHALGLVAERFVPLPRGNDGLTRLERRRDLARFNATVGHRPPVTAERIEMLREMADKSPGRIWHRPGLSARSA